MADTCDPALTVLHVIMSLISTTNKHLPVPRMSRSVLPCKVFHLTVANMEGFILVMRVGLESLAWQQDADDQGLRLRHVAGAVATGLVVAVVEKNIMFGLAMNSIQFGTSKR